MKHLKRTRAWLSALFALIILITCISFPMSASANVGSAYTMAGAIEFYTNADIQGMAYWWDQCGYHSYWNRENTWSYVNSERLNSDVICLIGHACPDFIILQNTQGGSDIYVTTGTTNQSFNEVGLRSRSLSNVKLAYFAGCQTAATSASQNLPQVAILRGAKSAIGWRPNLNAYDALTFQSRFGYACRIGYTVLAAAQYAASFNDYNDNAGTKNYALYGNVGTVISKNARSAVRTPALEQDGGMISISYTYGDTNYQPIFNALSERFPHENWNNFEVFISSNTPDNRNFVVTVQEKVGAYETNSAYTIIFTDNQVTAIYDRTISGARDSTHRTATAAEIVSLEERVEENIAARGDGSVVEGHSGKHFYDLETGKFYYRLYTTVMYGQACEEVVTDYEII